MSLARNILIFHTGALGDLVLAWPKILGVARVMPQCRVIVITHGQKAKLVEQVLRVESRDIENGWANLFGDGHLPEKGQKLLTGARLVLSFVAEEGSQWARQVRAVAPEAEIHFLPARPPANYQKHATKFLLERLETDPILHSAASGMLDSIRKSGLGSRTFDPSGPVIIHPGSGSTTKNWPVERWVEVIKKLDRPANILLGEVELEKMPKRDRAALAGLVPVVESKDLDTLLATLTGAAGFLGHDSGPSHLAAMLGLPTLALFGPTDPAVWSPIGPHVATVRHEPLEELGVGPVLAAWKSLAGGITAP